MERATIAGVEEKMLEELDRRREPPMELLPWRGAGL
jgi:hypothetical protein